MRFRDLFKHRTGSTPTRIAPEDALPARAERALQAGDLELALGLYDELIAGDAAVAQSHYKRANALNRLGRAQEALASYERAIALDPAYANAHCNRGVVLEGLRRWAEALAAYDTTLALNPADSFAAYNRGSVLKELGRCDEALASYDRAIALHGSYVEAYVNRGHLLHQLGRYEAAIASYDAAIEINPGYPAAFHGRGNTQAKLRRLAEAVASYAQAISLQDDSKYLLGVYMNAKMQICDWQGFASNLQRLTEGLQARRAVCTPFSALALVSSPGLQRTAAEVYAREEHPPGHVLGEIGSRPPHGKIRVGYFSADFRNHPVALLSAELFEIHDRSKFQIIAFAFGPETDDPMRIRLRDAFDRFIDIRDMSDTQAASLARELEIDIAVDLGGHTAEARTNIFALRAAPVQVNYLGYPGTMGADYIDYLIADPIVVPPALVPHYTEKIVYLPDSFLPHDSTRAIAACVYTREQCGIPTGAFVFCCFNNSYKINPPVFDAWMRILGRVEDSILWLSRHHPAAMENLRREASNRGIDPARLVFAQRAPSQAEYLARLRLGDLFLDTLPYNAHTTAIDALWAGLPVLTCLGEPFASRVAASLLQAAKLPELIAVSPEQYEDLAVRLAQTPALLAALRERLASGRHTAPLFDTPKFARNLESIYRGMYQRYQRESG